MTFTGKSVTILVLLLDFSSTVVAWVFVDGSYPSIDEREVISQIILVQLVGQLKSKKVT